MSERESFVLGQKYAYATSALVVGLVSYLQFLGMEKALVAVVFGWLALKRTPGPALKSRRAAAITGLVLGAGLLVLVPAVLATHADQLQRVIQALESLPH